MPISIFELVIISCGLAMDAFAVSICKGLSFEKLKASKVLIVGLYFGLFQMIMPIVGYFIGSTFSHVIEKYDHWVAFIILCVIGANMIREAFKKEEKLNDSLKFPEMILLALATSIDALAVGISFALIGYNNRSIFIGCSVIGVITFAISCGGVVIGNFFGSKNKKIAEIIGGICLILIGLKILIQDLISSK